MELVEGETLEHRLVKGPLPPEQTLRFAAQIADALAKAHKMGITPSRSEAVKHHADQSRSQADGFRLAKESGPAPLADARRIHFGCRYGLAWKSGNSKYHNSCPSVREGTSVARPVPDGFCLPAQVGYLPLRPRPICVLSVRGEVELGFGDGEVELAA